MAQLTYRDAITVGLAQELAHDPNVVFLGEDVAGAGGVFKATPGLLEQFGPKRVRDAPISEQAILGAAMGAAMTGLRPIAEIRFSDFLAVCWDIVANEIAKSRYMTDGQMAFPLVIRTANGGGSRFGAQHSQSVENWAMMIPGIKVVAPSTAEDAIGLLAAAVRDREPVHPQRGDRHRSWPPTCSARARPSAMRLTAMTSSEMAAAGAIRAHGVRAAKERASRIMRPQSGFGGWTPAPRKPSEATRKMA